MPKKSEKSHADEQTGLVISYYGSTVSVETAAGAVIPCHLRRNQELPVVGDVVAFQLEANSETGIVLGIKPRRTVLVRGETRGKQMQKPVAANIDVLVIVMAPPPVFSSYLVDRYMIAAELLNIAVILVINKADLLSSEMRAETERLCAPYQNVPYPVVFSSIISDGGLEELKHLLEGKVGVLVGPSGVGKSSLIGALGGDDDIKVGDVTTKGAGKHTTTATRLYHLAGNGKLIDSPGVREFNLWPITPAEVLKGFKELNNGTANCRFRDCSHAVEPGCAVQQAVADGRISPERYKSYQEFIKTAIKPDDQYQK